MVPNMLHTNTQGPALSLPCSQSLRAIVKSLDRVADDDIHRVSIPNGVPLLYRLDAAGRPLRLEEDGLISGVWLGDDEARRRVANAGQILDRQVA